MDEDKKAPTFPEWIAIFFILALSFLAFSFVLYLVVHLWRAILNL